MRPARFGVTLFLAAAGPAAKADISYEVAKESDLTIMEIYAPLRARAVWGEDLLQARVLPHGEAGAFVILDQSSRCDYDDRLDFENGREQARTVPISDAPSLTVRSAP